MKNNHHLIIYSNFDFEWFFEMLNNQNSDLK